MESAGRERDRRRAGGWLPQRDLVAVVSQRRVVNGDVLMKRVTATALSLLATITPAVAQPAEVALMFDCSAFTHIVWACLPPSNARDSANGMASTFMSAAIRLGRERHMSYGKLNAAAMAALRRQRAMAGNTCRLDVLVRNYGKLCDALIGHQQMADETDGRGCRGQCDR
jgi:hypothetical protein